MAEPSVNGLIIAEMYTWSVRKRRNISRRPASSESKSKLSGSFNLCTLPNLLFHTRPFSFVDVAIETGIITAKPKPSR